MGQSESILEVEESVQPRPKLHKVVLSELTHLTKFDVTQLQRLYGNFMEENPDGTIQRDLFITRNLNMSNFGDAKFWGHIFDMVDEDQNDEISFAEWVVTLSLLKKGTAKVQLKWLFDVFDRDNTGLLSRSELEFVFNLIFTFYPQVCNDRTPKEFVNQLLDTLDTNHDDKLSQKEFIEGAKQFPVLFDCFLILADIVIGQAEIVESEGGTSGSLTPRSSTIRPNRYRPAAFCGPPRSSSYASESDKTRG